MRAPFIAALLVAGAAATTAVPAQAAPATDVRLVARDDSRPNGFQFRGAGCESTSTYSFAFPAKARNARLDRSFTVGRSIEGPGVDGYGPEGENLFDNTYARITAITRRTVGGRVVFDISVKAEADSCAGYRDAKTGATVPGWITVPVQVFGYYRLTVNGLWTIDVLQKLRSAPPKEFAIGKGRVVSQIRWANWGEQVAKGRGWALVRGRQRRYTIEAYNPENCRKRIFYIHYLIEGAGERRFRRLSDDCRRSLPS